jgi:hypothetical protein
VRNLCGGLGIVYLAVLIQLTISWRIERLHLPSFDMDCGQFSAGSIVGDDGLDCEVEIAVDCCSPVLYNISWRGFHCFQSSKDSLLFFYPLKVRYHAACLPFCPLALHVVSVYAGYGVFDVRTRRPGLRH